MVNAKNQAEKDLEDFLASLPPWFRKLLQNGFASLTKAERDALIHDDHFSKLDVPGLIDSPLSQSRVTGEYESLLQRIPERWHEYRVRV